MKKLSFLLLCAVLSACTSSSYEVNSPVDLSEKTIAIPPGGGKVISSIKKQLRAEGWQIVVLNNTETSTIRGNKITTSKSADARYTLYYTQRRWETCITGEARIDVESSLIDNRTNEEMFNYNASACENDVAENIVQLIQGKQPSKPKFSGN